jgi:hypothetical protein
MLFITRLSTSIDLPGSLTSLGSYAFADCTSLTGTVTIPAGVTVIPDYCFYEHAITEVVFEGAVTEIGTLLFMARISPRSTCRVP